MTPRPAPCLSLAPSALVRQSCLPAGLPRGGARLGSSTAHPHTLGASVHRTLLRALSLRLSASCLETIPLPSSSCPQNSCHLVSPCLLNGENTSQMPHVCLVNKGEKVVTPDYTIASLPALHPRHLTLPSLSSIVRYSSASLTPSPSPSPCHQHAQAPVPSPGWHVHAGSQRRHLTCKGTEERCQGCLLSVRT